MLDAIYCRGNRGMVWLNTYSKQCRLMRCRPLARCGLVIWKKMYIENSQDHFTISKLCVICMPLQYLSKFNPRPAGGGVFEHPAMRFFVNSLKTAARSSAVFGTPYHTSFPHMLCKCQTQVTQGQVTRSRQVTSPHKTFECSSTLHQLNDCLETFSICYNHEYL